MSNVKQNNACAHTNKMGEGVSWREKVYQPGLILLRKTITGLTADSFQYLWCYVVGPNSCTAYLNTNLCMHSANITC